MSEQVQPYAVPELSPSTHLVNSWLEVPADELDRTIDLDTRQGVIESLREVNARSLQGDGAASYEQQWLLSRIYAISMRLPEKVTAEGSSTLNEVTRLLERATLDAEDGQIDEAVYDDTPADPEKFLSWLKEISRQHKAYKHPYYVDFIRNQATSDDLRSYAIQESVVDGRFDDLLATMQVGSLGATKLEIAQNYWDEMGNGDPTQVHTHLFDQIFQVFNISSEDLESALTAEALRSGNLAVLLCKYRHHFPEAVGFLGILEWFSPHRFANVVHAWERVGLPNVGIQYHRLHVTVDSTHAAGWFHNVVVPSADSAFMRRGITRGALIRLNSSARYLDERLGLTDAVAV